MIILLPRDIYMCLHDMSHLMMSLTRSFQVEDNWGLAPTGRPMYLNCKDSYLQWKKSQAISKKTWSKLTNSDSTLDEIHLKS